MEADLVALDSSEIWLVWDAQQPRGSKVPQDLVEHAHKIACALSTSDSRALKVVCMATGTTPQDVAKACFYASAAPRCAGVIFWTRHFAPSKMWIHGLDRLRKPCLFLQTQFRVETSLSIEDPTCDDPVQGERDCWTTISTPTRMRISPKIVVGHWSDPEVKDRVIAWVRAAQAWHDLQDAHLCCFEDDRWASISAPDCKSPAERCFGLSLDKYDFGQLDDAIGSVQESEVSIAAERYAERYHVAPALAGGGVRHLDLRSAVRQEIAMRSILGKGSFKAFTVPPEKRGQRQLSSFACQRLMADGHGFARDSDALLAALVRAMKVMGEGLCGGSTFMEPHIEHLSPRQERVLGSGSFEVCETIAASKPAIRVYASGRCGDDDPVRIVFDAIAGSASTASLIDLGDRFRLVVSEITAIEPNYLLESRASRVMWTCKPDYKTARAAWILAGGSGRIGYSNSVTVEMLKDFARVAGMEVVTIDRRTDLESLEEQLKIGECWYVSTRGTIA